MLDMNRTGQLRELLLSEKLIEEEPSKTDKA